jgi:hypothetical protein
LDRSKLLEVVIERKRHFDAKLVHDDFACAVGEAPILIFKLLKRFPRKLQIRGGDLVYFRKFMTKESCA